MTVKRLKMKFFFSLLNLPVMTPVQVVVGCQFVEKEGPRSCFQRVRRKRPFGR